MARTHARVKGSIWADEDWRQLRHGAQWAYTMLISQPHINNCGVLPYLPTRWARMQSDATTAEIEDMIAELEHHGFVIVDADAGEILVRSFIKHDGVEKVPNILNAAKKQYEEVESRLIRHALAEEYPHLFTYTGPEPHKRHKQADQVPVSEPLGERVAEPLAKPLVERDNARVPPHPTPTTTPAASSARERANDEEPAAAALKHTLEHDLKWRPWQTTRGLADPDRAQAWATEATALHQDGQVDNPGGYAWANFDAGGTPTAPASTTAPGTFGSTRSAKPPRNPHACPEPHCGSTFKTQTRLDEHTADCHTEHERTPIPAEVATLISRATPANEPPSPPAPRTATTKEPNHA